MKQFGSEVDANVWTAETDNVLASMYDLMESRSFERNISEVFEATLGKNQGKILFSIDGVKIEKAIEGGMIHSPKLIQEGLVTELELQMILRNQNWLDNAIFYEGGKILSKESIIDKGIKIIK